MDPAFLITRIPIKISGDPARDTVQDGEVMTTAGRPNAPMDYQKAPKVAEALKGQTILEVWYSLRDNLSGLPGFQSIEFVHDGKSIYVNSTYSDGGKKVRATIQVTAYVLHRK